MGRILGWLNGQSVAVKILVLFVPVALFIVASPVFAFVAFMGLLFGLIFLVVA